MKTLRVALVASLFAASAWADDIPAIWKSKCASCHGEDGKAQTTKGKNLKARNFTDAEWQADKTNADLIKTVTEGKDDMPPFGKKLTPEQIESLVKNDVRGFAPQK